MKLPDVNVLVHAGNPQAAQHRRARAWLVEAGNGREALALPWIVLLGFIRLSTRAGIYARPLPVAQAMSSVRHWLAAPAAMVVQPGPQHLDILTALLTRIGTAGNLTTDAHIAAVAVEHGATVVSFDRDFARFDGVPFELLA